MERKILEMQRKFMLGTLALILPLGLAAGLGAGPATAQANLTGTGLVNCSKLSGTVTYTPPLTLAPKTVTTVTKVTASGCKGGTPTPTSFVISSSTVTKSDTCTNLSKGGPVSYKVAYSPSSIAPSTFKGTITASPSTAKPLYFKVKGVTAGSYMSTTSSATAYISQSYNSLVSACTGTGLHALTVVSGSTANG
jgi:hypothetical protein